MNKLSSLSLELNRKQTTSLPTVDNRQVIRYQNDFQDYGQLSLLRNHTNKKEHFKPQLQASQQISRLTSRNSSTDKQQMSSVYQGRLQTNEEQLQAHMGVSGNKGEFVSSNSLVNQTSHYREKSVQSLQVELRKMRSQFTQMNQTLNNMLDQYMARTQLQPKQLIQPSRRELYQKQLYTNRRMQQSQLNELKKLNQVQINVKDKDVLIDLQHLLIEMRQELHHGRKNQYDARLKLHKQDLFLDDIIKANQDNQDNNQVKLLKLQMIYYMKRQNCLKTHQQQLQHQEKLIKQNDKNLDLKLQDIKKNSKSYYLVDQRYQKNISKYESLQDKKKSLKRNIDSLRKSNQITEQKYARQILEMYNQTKINIKPLLIKYDEDNQQLQQIIKKLINTYDLNDKVLRDIKYKFSQDLLLNKSKDNDKKTYFKNDFKPNLPIQRNSKIQDFKVQSYSVHKPRQRFLSSLFNQDKNQNQNGSLYGLNLANCRQNDKNVSTVHFVNKEQNQKQKNLSQSLLPSLNLKPRNFRIMNKKQKQPSTQMDRNKSYSLTIDHSNYGNSVQFVNKPNLLKPKLLFGGTARIHSQINSLKQWYFQFSEQTLQTTVNNVELDHLIQVPVDFSFTFSYHSAPQQISYYFWFIPRSLEANFEFRASKGQIIMVPQDI